MPRWTGLPLPACTARLESLELRVLLSAGPVISEFLADNDTVLADEDGEFRDWIEIHNPTLDDVDLAGWHLTDDASDLTQWTFPAVNLPAGGYRVVFASEKDRADPAGELHTNFKLSAGGEYLALVRPDGVTVADAYDPEYPEQVRDVSFGRFSAEQVLLAEADEAAYRVPTADDAGLGAGWTAVDYDESAWQVGRTGVGFSASPGAVQTDIEAEMRGLNASLWVRADFAVADTAEIATLTLQMKYDDAFVAYLNGTEVLSSNAPASPAWDSAALTDRPDPRAESYEAFDLTAWTDLLTPGVNVLAIHAMNDDAANGEMLVLPVLTATGVQAEGHYFASPSPGGANLGGAIDFVDDVAFSHERGFYDAAFDLTLTCATEGAEIRYTTNGLPPSATTGTVYTAPVTIDHTTTLRAAAFRAGYETLAAQTHTFLFPGDIVSQDVQATRDAGLPAKWGSITPDYGMDPDVIGTFDPATGLPNGDDDFGGVYAATIRDDLQSLPTLSIVMDVDDLFGGSGIYTNSTQHGSAWERPTSMELIFPDGQASFQTDAGLRIQGGAFRSNGLTKKHSFRLLFRGEYGEEKLRYPLFGPDAAGEFDTITLRAGANDGYAWNSARNTEQYIRDEFGRQLQLATGHVASHGTFVHLYLNGVYWGLYNPVERPDDSFSATYSGGDKETWDAINSGTASNGDKAAWNELVGQLNAGMASAAAYQKIQGNNPDGSRNPAYPVLLDVPNYVDYMILNFWGGNWDWPNKNYWIGRDQTDASEGFQFYTWDFENTMGNNRSRSPLDMVSPRASVANSGVGIPHQALLANEEYRLYFADRVQDLFLNGGVLSPESLVPRYQALADQVERAMVAESARWGDTHFSTPMTLTQWTAERDWILNTYLTQRTGIVLGQFIDSGLYPSTPPASFVVDGSPQRGGPVAPGAELAFAGGAGSFYYTLDGTDPRLEGGGVSPSARVWTGGVSQETFVAKGAAWKYFDQGTDLGAAWREPGFDDGAWPDGPGQLGYGEGDEATTVGYGPNAQDKYPTTYFRHTFQAVGADEITALTLNVLRDDGAVVYLNGQEAGRSNMPAGEVQYGTRAEANVAGANEDKYFALTVDPALLTEGANVLAVEIHQIDATSYDLSFDLELQATRTQSAGGVALDQSLLVTVRARNGSTWSAIDEAIFDTGQAASLAVTEINYNPYGPTDDEAALGFVDKDEFEFIEIQNVGAQPLHLAAYRFTNGVDFDFARSGVTELEPGQYVLVVRNTAAFEARYGAGHNLAGEYGGDKLSNDGERLTLSVGQGAAVLDFTYGDSAPWTEWADGLGGTLRLEDPAALPDPGEAGSWRGSAEVGGSPGAAGAAVAIPPVVVNEVLTHTDPPDVDTIELHNPTGADVDVGGWFLSDTKDDVRKFRIPAGTLIPAGGYAVFDETDFNPSGGLAASDFALDGAHGDDVWLVSADAAGALTGHVEHVDFGAAANGVSFARWPDGEGALFPANATTFGAANTTGPRFGPLVIGEVHYHPAPAGGQDADKLEFVEIHNPTGADVDLTHWQIRGDVDYDFPPGRIIPAGGVVTVVNFDPADAAPRTAFLTAYGLDASVVLLGPYGGKLANDAGAVRLRRPDEPPPDEPAFYPALLEDEVKYQDAAGWPAQADGAGMSLLRIAADLWGNDPANWVAAPPTPGVRGPVPLIVSSGPTEVAVGAMFPVAWRGGADGQKVDIWRLGPTGWCLLAPHVPAADGGYDWDTTGARPGWHTFAADTGVQDAAPTYWPQWLRITQAQGGVGALAPLGAGAQADPAWLDWRSPLRGQTVSPGGAVEIRWEILLPEAPAERAELWVQAGEHSVWTLLAGRVDLAGGRYVWDTAQTAAGEQYRFRLQPAEPGDFGPVTDSPWLEVL